MGLREWREAQLKRVGLRFLFYVTPVAHLRPILQEGILPRCEASQRLQVDVSNPSVQEIRARKRIRMSDGVDRSLHEVVPLFFTTSTPMLWSLQDRWTELVILVVDALILADPRVESAFGDGNLACAATRSYRSLAQLDMVPWESIEYDYVALLGGNDRRELKRERNAEIVVYPRVDANYIGELAVMSEAAKESAEAAVTAAGRDIGVLVEERLFRGMQLALREPQGE